MDLKGEIKNYTKNQIDFFYRGNNLEQDLIILSAVFKGKLSDKKKIMEKKTNLISKKKKDQPTRIKTCGSTFKNPLNNKKAWELINISGCANLKIGGASISEKHNNFFINNGMRTFF